MANGSDRVTVSLDTLRTEIRAANSELELSLRKYIGAELDRKAPMDVVLSMNAQLTELNRTSVAKEGPLMVTLATIAHEWEGFARGELRPAMRNAIEEVIVELVNSDSDRKWSGRERMLATAAIFFWLVSTVVALAGLVFK